MLGLIKALLSIASSLSEYAQQRQLIDAGEAKALLRGIKDADEAIARAARIRAGVDHSPGSVRDDPNNRDNW